MGQQNTEALRQADPGGTVDRIVCMRKKNLAGLQVQPDTEGWVSITPDPEALAQAGPSAGVQLPHPRFRKSPKQEATSRWTHESIGTPTGVLPQLHPLDRGSGPGLTRLYPP